MLCPGILNVILILLLMPQYDTNSISYNEKFDQFVVMNTWRVNLQR